MASISLERAKDVLEKVPYSIVTAVGIAFLLYQFYFGFQVGEDFLGFYKKEDSPKLKAEDEISLHDKNIAALDKKLQDSKDFYRSLEKRRVELRSMAQQLDEMKATLSDQLDIPIFMKSVIQEAGKVGLQIVGLKPTLAKKYEYYAEQSFDMSISGVYIQLLVFLDHLSNIDRIVRVDNFELKRTGSSTAPYVNLQGTIQVKAYYYLGTHADEVATNLKNNSSFQPVPGTAPPAATPPAGGGK